MKPFRIEDFTRHTIAIILTVHFRDVEQAREDLDLRRAALKKCLYSAQKRIAEVRRRNKKA